MMVNVVNFDFGASQGVTLQLASAEGLSPLPLPEAIVRFQAAMSDDGEAACMDHDARRAVSAESPAVMMTEVRTGLSALLRSAGKDIANAVEKVETDESAAEPNPWNSASPVNEAGKHGEFSRFFAQREMHDETKVVTILPAVPIPENDAVTMIAVEPAAEMPVMVVAKPVVVAEKPVMVAEKPVVVVEKPAAAETPVVVAEKPVIVAEKPVMVAEKPVMVVEKPVVVAEKPVIVAEKPVVAEKSVMVAEKPVIVAEKPVMVAEKPVVAERPQIVTFEKSPDVMPESLVVKGAEVKTVSTVMPEMEEAVVENEVSATLPAAPTPQIVAPAETAPAPQVAVAQAARTEAIVEAVGKAVEIVSQVVEAVVAQIDVTPTLAQGEGEIRITLKPTVLDGSEIRLTAKAGELVVSIAPATNESARIAQQNLTHLETALAAHAPSFHHVAVVIAAAKKGKMDETA